MAVVNKNFSKVTTPLPPFDTETEFIGCNFSKRVPDTSGVNPIGVRLWPGDDTPRIFTKCNLMNCEPPPGSTIVGGNTCVKEFDVAGTVQVITVDGIEVDSYTNTFERIHGHLDPATLTYVYHPEDLPES